MKTVRLDPPQELSMPIGEAMFTQRAIRRLDPDRPFGDDQLKTILDAASKAPNGGNAQPGRFLVIRDRRNIEAFAKLYYEAWWAKRRQEFGWEPGHDIPRDSPYRMASYLASNIANAQAIILAFTVGTHFGGSLFPAVQNLLLAARAQGIGSVLTTLHPTVMDRVARMFDVPDEAAFHCCIPLGYPQGNFGPTSRFESADTTYWDRWDARPPWAD